MMQKHLLATRLRVLPAVLPAHARSFSCAQPLREILDVRTLPDRITPKYQDSKTSDLQSLKWPEPPRNILLVKKDCAETVTESLLEFANHIHSTYPSISIILEPAAATEVHERLPFPVYTTIDPEKDAPTEIFPQKIDMTTTLGGDGTILRAASLFSSSRSVPPVLSFSMGTLGFLGEWKFAEYKRAFREVFMSGAGLGSRAAYLGEPVSKLTTDEGNDTTSTKPASEETTTATGWSCVTGKIMGETRSAKLLTRNRLHVGLFSASGSSIDNPVYAMNEVIIHRGKDPHLAIVEVFVGGRFLTEAVADGMIISTPTGSTAYSLSSGGSIVHPLVGSILLTPICPRSLSFRPLVLPSSTPVTLRLSQRNRAREVEVSVDGVRRTQGIGIGMEIRVSGEQTRKGDGTWTGGGIPCVMRKAVGSSGVEGDDGWVGGLNGLLKFNYPFGEEEGEGTRV